MVTRRPRAVVRRRGGTVDPNAMPVGNLTGWNQVYTEDFSTLAAVGQVANVYNSDMHGYVDGTLSTNGQNQPGNNGYYYPSKVLSVQNNVTGASNGTALDWFLHTETIDGISRHMAATPTPQGWVNQTYGRYSVRMRADSLAGYKTAFLLWPEVVERWDWGEIDFPEGELNKMTTGAVHAMFPDDPVIQDSWLLMPASNVFLTDWHVYTIDWIPGHIRMYIDGVLQKDFTDWIPATPHYWALQVETEHDPPLDATQGHLQVDWMTVYEYVMTAPTLFAERWPGVNGTALSAQWGQGPYLGTVAVDGENNAVITTAATPYEIGITLRGSGMTPAVNSGVSTSLQFSDLTECYTTVGIRTDGQDGGTIHPRNGYMVEMNPASGAYEVRRSVNDVQTTLAAVPFTYRNGKYLNIRLEAIGSLVRAKCWYTTSLTGTGVGEPSAWGYSGTDPAPMLTAGVPWLSVGNGAAATARPYRFGPVTVYTP